MNIIIKSEKIQELEVIVDEHYNKEVLPIYLKKYGAGILQIIDREIQEMKQYLIYEYVMQCLKDQEPEVDAEVVKVPIPEVVQKRFTSKQDRIFQQKKQNLNRRYTVY